MTRFSIKNKKIIDEILPVVFDVSSNVSTSLRNSQSYHSLVSYLIFAKFLF